MLRNGGEVLFNRMGMPLDSNDLIGINSLHGLTISDKIIYQVLPDAKLNDLRQRTVDRYITNIDDYCPKENDE